MTPHLFTILNSDKIVTQATQQEVSVDVLLKCGIVFIKGEVITKELVITVNNARPSTLFEKLKPLI